MKSIPFMIAGIPEAFLPLCGPEILSHYRCQFPDCTQVFSQKASSCNHIHRDHLNVALACINCSVKRILKCAGSVPLPGRVTFVNISKKAFQYSLMILLLQTYPQKLLYPPQVPSLILFQPISFWKGLK